MLRAQGSSAEEGTYENVPMIKIIHSSILCKWANLQNQQGIK